ncbi:tropomyosin-1, isoforms 33/34-like [Macrobrachium rosenbergii]|uniref:tropomyosin-1, isoforms 33/34-like n=1 Tax=Macrobrachium rosenbergii TaxID=79674 RepID=UPI0034D4BAB0
MKFLVLLSLAAMCCARPQVVFLVPGGDQQAGAAPPTITQEHIAAIQRSIAPILQQIQAGAFQNLQPVSQFVPNQQVAVAAEPVGAVPGFAAETFASNTIDTGANTGAVAAEAVGSNADAAAAAAAGPNSETVVAVDATSLADAPAVEAAPAGAEAEAAEAEAAEAEAAEAEAAEAEAAEAEAAEAEAAEAEAAEAEAAEAEAAEAEAGAA